VSGAVADLFGQAVKYHQAGRLGEAEALYRRILAGDPDHADSLHLLGVIAAQRGRNDAAIELIGRAVRLRPRNPDYQNNLGLALFRLGRLGEAAAAHEKALKLKPNHREALNNLGNVHLAERRLDAAERCYRAALRADADYVEAHANLAATLAATDRLDEAEQHCRHALKLNPRYVEALNTLGDILRNRGRVVDAEGAYRQALRHRPDWAALHYNLGNLLLLTGQFEAGWAEYEGRHRARNAGHAPRFTQPQWHGEPLDGRSLLLTAEQGAGDTILFCRYAPLIAGGRVLVEAPAPLRRLLASLPGIELVGEGAPPPFDLHCPLPSLPLAFTTRRDTIPAAIPYLAGDPALIESWRARLADLPGRKIGLAWAGNPDHVDDHRRSIAPELLEALAGIPDAAFISLQKDAAARPAPALEDWTAELGDFADTAALIAGLDLVISVDTSIAHLAGALGKPVWLLNRFDPHWVWLRGRTDSPWYPTLRQFRQPTPGDWGSVMAAARIELERFCGAAAE
jgi:Flp pilus assembly protein TadD